MTMRRINQLFFVVLLGALGLFLYNLYSDYLFENNPLSADIQHKIAQKKRVIIDRAFRHYGIHFDPPIIISDQMDAAMFGLAVYKRDGTIQVLLNKKRFRENVNYMIR